MSKITKAQMDLLRKEILDHVERKVYGGFKKWIEIWEEYSDKTANPILDFINMDIGGWAGYPYRPYVNIERIYKNCGFDQTFTLDEFYLIFDRLWITTAVKIITKEICSSNDELAY